MIPFELVSLRPLGRQGRFAWAWALAAAASLLASPLQVREGGWVRLVPPSAEVTAAYLVLENAGPEPDALIGASSAAAREVELHETVERDGQMKMVKVDRMELPAGGKLELRPRGPHLMLVGLTAPLREGDQIPLQLRFASGKVVEVQLPVRRQAPNGPPPPGK